jgi:6-phosphogluconolactonase (cycloisomerase 2 family)
MLLVSRALTPLLAAISLIAFAAPAGATPVYTQQDCFNATGVDGCAASPQLGNVVAGIPSPDGKFIYGLAGGGGITVWSRSAPFGALTRVPGCYQATNANGCTAFASIQGPDDMAFGPAGTTAYVAMNSGYLGVFARDADTGALTSQKECLSDAVSPTAPCTNPSPGDSFLDFARSVIVSPDGLNVYVASSGRGPNGALDGVTRFTRNTSNGLVAAIGCIAESSIGGCAAEPGLEQGTSQMAMSADGKFLYTTGKQDDAVGVYSRNASSTPNAGALSFVACYSPTNAGCSNGPPILSGAYSVLIPPPPGDQSKLYVGTANGVAVFNRNAGTGELTLLQCLNAAGVNNCTKAPGLGLGSVTSLALSPDGTDLAVGGSQDSVNSGVVFLKRDPATGLLSELPGECVTHDGTSGTCRTDTAVGGWSIVRSAPDASQFYFGSLGTDSLSGYRADNPPVCTGTTVNTAFQASVAVPMSCTDPDGDPVAVGFVHAPAHGGISAIDQAAQTTLYTPASGFSGPDAFQFLANAHGLTAAPATDTINVGPAPTPPTPRITSAIHTQWLAGSTTKVKKLSVSSVPKSGKVKVSCKGAKHAKHKGGCPFSSKTYKEPNGKSSLSLTSKFKHAKLQPGTVVTIDITATGSIGKEARFTIRKRKLPTTKTYCLPVGSTKPRSHC